MIFGSKEIRKKSTMLEGSSKPICKVSMYCIGLFYYELHTRALFSCRIHTGARPCARLYRPYRASHNPIGV